jgi:hypothetical protein
MTDSQNKRISSRIFRGGETRETQEMKNLWQDEQEQQEAGELLQLLGPTAIIGQISEEITEDNLRAFFNNEIHLSIIRTFYGKACTFKTVSNLKEDKSNFALLILLDGKKVKIINCSINQEGYITFEMPTQEA